MKYYLQKIKGFARAQGRRLRSDAHSKGREKSVIRDAFDSAYYLAAYPDVATSGMDPLDHFIEYGWKEGRNPNKDFNTSTYVIFNPDVREAKINPFYHYLVYGKAEKRSGANARELNMDYARSMIPHVMQDMMFPLETEQAEALFVIVVPEHNTMSGGIYSFFSIAKAVYGMRHKHRYRVVLMTRPNLQDVTYTRQQNFRNAEDVFRFEQIERYKNAKEIYLHVPEYAAPSFVSSLKSDTLAYLKSRERLYINILNQNIKLMPEKEEFEDLRELATELTQSVAHHSYFGQEWADRYDLPTLLLPAYTDLSAYEPIEFEEKEKLIIYSPDDSPHREAVLQALKRGAPDYELVEIRNITFDKFMDLATRCRFSITFGEGFDGYIAQPIYQKGIGMAVYNAEFFPSENLIGFKNIFSSNADMVDNIVSRIRMLEESPELYRMTNRQMLEIYDSLYSREDYLRRIELLVKRDFEIPPGNRIRDVIGWR